MVRALPSEVSCMGNLAIDAITASVLLALDSRSLLTWWHLLCVPVAAASLRVLCNLWQTPDKSAAAHHSSQQSVEADKCAQSSSWKLQQEELQELVYALGAYAAIVTDVSAEFQIAAPCRELELLVGMPVLGQPLAMFLTGTIRLKQLVEASQGHVPSVMTLGDISVGAGSDNTSQTAFELKAMSLPASRRITGENRCVFFLVHSKLANARHLHSSSSSRHKDSDAGTSCEAQSRTSGDVLESQSKSHTTNAFERIADMLDDIELAFVVFNHPQNADLEIWNKNVWANRFALKETRRPSLEAFLDAGEQEWKGSSAAVRQRSVEVYEAVQLHGKVFTQTRTMFSTGPKSSYVFTSQMPLKMPSPISCQGVKADAADCSARGSQHTYALNVVFAWIDEMGRSPYVGEPRPLEQLPVFNASRLMPMDDLIGFGTAVLDYSSHTSATNDAHGPVLWASTPMLNMLGLSSLADWQASHLELHRQNSILQEEHAMLHKLVQLGRRKLVTLQVRSCASCFQWMPGIAVVAYLPVCWEASGRDHAVILRVEVPLDGIDDSCGDSASNVRLQAHSMTHAASAIAVYDGEREKLVAQNPMAARLKVPPELSNIFMGSPVSLASMRKLFEEKEMVEPWGPYCIPGRSQTWYEVSVAKVRSPLHGQSAYVYVATLLDVTSTRNRERHIFAAVNALVDATFDARIWVAPTDAKLVVRAAGPKAQHFFQADKLAGHDLLKFVSERDQQRLAEYVLQVNASATSRAHVAHRIHVSFLRAGDAIQVDICGACFGPDEICLAINEAPGTGDAVWATARFAASEPKMEVRDQLSNIGQDLLAVLPMDSISQMEDRRCCETASLPPGH